MKPMIRVNVKTMIITIILFMTMITTVGCKADKKPVVTNDLLYRETIEITEVSEICNEL